MPIYIPPISRRRFLKSAAAAAGAGMLAQNGLLGAIPWRSSDPHRVALLSDTHIDADLARTARSINMADHLKQAIGEVIQLNPAPSHVLINGDFSYDKGDAEDYLAAVKLIQPIREAGLPLHIGLGNHDHRENFWAGFPKERRPLATLKEKHVTLIATPRANWLMLDSLNVTHSTPGMIGANQLKWLAGTLDQNASKPAILVVHHNPMLPGGPKAAGIEDTEKLIEVISPRKQVKAVIYGHTHRWDHKILDDGLHLVNLPAVAYVFSADQPSGWVDARLGMKGATLELRTLDPKHAWSRSKLTLKWRA